MTNSNDQTGGMGRLSKKTKEKVDEALKDEELSVLKSTTVNLESLRPRISDQESFDKLIAAVKISTQQNENIALLSNRISALGKGVIKVASEVIKNIPKV